MEQLQWMFSLLYLLPDWVWHLTVLAGIVGLAISLLIRFIPFIGVYKLPLQIISLILLLLGAYLEGGMDCRNAGKVQNEAFRQAEEKGQQATAVIDNEVKDKNTQIAANTEKQIEYVDRIKTVVKNVPGPKIVETLVKDMSPEERAKYEAKSKEEKDKYEKQILELQQNLQNCPIPSLIIEEMNKAAKGDKK